MDEQGETSRVINALEKLLGHGQTKFPARKGASKVIN